MPNVDVIVIAASFLTVALICSLTSISHLEAISQPSQGGGYPNYEPNPASPGLFGSVGNATNPGNNTGTLPPGSIFKVPPGNTSSNNIRNTTNPENITGTLPPNVFTFAGNGTNISNNTGPVLPGLVKPTGNLTNALPSTGNNSGPLPPPGSIVNLTRNATHEPPG